MEQKWDNIIQPNKQLFNLNFKAIWKYKDLLMLFVRRDFVANYKQTILGPTWFFIQPIFTSLVLTIVFGNMAALETDGIPKFPFYLAGVTIWGYFADCINKTSETFTVNQGLFGKVYFPRIIVPLSVVLTNMLKFVVQFILFLCIWTYYYFTTDGIAANSTMLLIPVFVILMALMGLGLGMIISSMTTKYRDLKFLVSFGVQLMMYLSAVIIPLSSANGWMKKVMLVSPMTSIIESFKYSFFTKGSVPVGALIYTAVFSVAVFILGMVIFNRVEKSFIDTV
ncbi:MAG: lipopolysaccharide transport system permease protein [Parvicellaceae bacterium]|jgi:lipopolysaccharide transport system permease protein